MDKSRSDYFIEAVTEMSVAGIDLRIWQQAGRFAEKLFFAPGFVEPWPQWKDVNIEYWCDEDKEVYHRVGQTQEDLLDDDRQNHGGAVGDQEKLLDAEQEPGYEVYGKPSIWTEDEDNEGEPAGEAEQAE